MFLVIYSGSVTKADDLSDALDAVVEAQDNSTKDIYLVDIEQEQTYAYYYYEHLGSYDAAITISHSQY